MEEPVKGTVTSLSSLFPPEEAHKASKRVQDTIADRHKDLDQLREFIDDNTSLINLVQKLPEELHHDIMVPFGKAAFFPGRLIHTNEFLVLLGEGYYADRTSKQTIDILKRREKSLESQVESLNAAMQDLKAEASFFDATAAEAAEGLVEIREYIEETPVEKVSKAGTAEPDPPNFSVADNMNAVVEDEDEEYARILSKMDELEREELAAESVNEVDEDENEDNARMMSMVDEIEKKELVVESVSGCNEDEHTKSDFGGYKIQSSLDQKPRSSEGHQLSNPPKQSKDEHTISKKITRKVTFQQDSDSQFEGFKVQSVSEVAYKVSSDKSSALNKASSAEKPLLLPEVKENDQVEPQSKNKLQAFTGSIVEHTHNLETSPRERTTASSKSTTPQTSKPVSRFKMQRR
ncbi:hypothetical protein ACSBR2_027429 [Camellia fascicularis]